MDDALSKSAKRWVLVAAIIGSSMAFVDGTVVNVALPAIQRELHATAAELQWVVESYALILASLLLVGGSLGDRYGRRRVFMLGVAVFAAASAGCALSHDVQWLILARGLQGVGGALLVPGSLALISAAFPSDERGRAIGTWSGFSGITAAVGPVFGGWLVDRHSWAWAFLINLPLAAAVLAIAWRRVPESRGSAATGRLDVGGALLATLALGGIVFALIEAPARGWHAPLVFGLLLAGGAALAGFIAVEAHIGSPMLPLTLFRSRNFSGANLLTLLLYAALGGSLYYLPLNLIQVQGYSATAAGAALLPFILIMFVFSRWTGRLADRAGPRLPLVAGPAIAALGFALLARPGLGGGYASTFLPGVVVLGIGMTLTVAPLTTTVMNALDAGQAGVASGVNNAVSRMASLLAIAAFGLVMTHAFDAGLARRLEAVQATREELVFLETQRARLADARLPPGIATARAAQLRRAIDESFVDGFRWVMGVGAGLALASAASAAWLIRREPAR